jgi:hypothetical protein
LIKKPKRKNNKNSKKKSLEVEFGWEFTASDDTTHNDRNYEELLKESYNYNDKLYEVHKEEFQPRKIVNSFEEELIEAAKKALDR